MTRQPFVVQPADYPRSLNVVGEHITVLASGTATGGYEIFLRKARKAVARRRTVTLGDESFWCVHESSTFGGVS